MRWERPDPNQSHLLYVDAEDRVVGEVWKDGVRWRVQAFNFSSYTYLTDLAAKKAVEQALT